MHHEKTIPFWIYVTLASLWMMILLGGLTRLTGSGLSITEWNPVRGVLPPLTHEDWVVLFEKYKQTPEFCKINSHFQLGDFQNIFWLEYIHRLWGRGIGVVFGFLTWKTYKSHFWAPFYKKRILTLWALGLCQGLVGWFMVKSGLQHDPYLSPFKLCFHLVVTGLIIFTLIGHLRTPKTLWVSQKFTVHVALILLSLTIIYGALVAGFKAGLIHNTFPTMNGHWIPHDILHLKPWWNNFTKNITTIQFTHRVLGTLTFASFLYVAAQCWALPSKPNRLFAKALFILAITQYALGVFTLLTQLNIILAALHQIVAFLLFSLLSWAFWKMRSYEAVAYRLKAT